MTTPTLVITGDTTGLQAALAAAERKIESLQNAAKRVKPPVPEASAFESALSGLGRYAAGLASVAAAVNLISKEWNNVIERQQKAAMTAVTFEEALGAATLNVGAVMGPDKLKERALKMSAKTGVAPATAVQAMSLAIKSGGATNEAEAERLAGAAEVAGALSPRAPAEKLADTAGSIASYMTRTGATAEQAGGVLLSMQSKSNIADANKAMAAMGPTLANMLAQGASVGLSQALAPALSQAIEDTQGDVSSLAASTFTQSLAEAGASRFPGQKNIPDLMLAHMRANPEVAQQFFTGELTDAKTGKALGKPELGRGKAETFFRAIAGDPSLEGDAEIKGSYRRQLDAYTAQALSDQQAGEFYSARLGQVRGATPNLQIQRQLRAAKERIQLTRGDARAGVSREGIEELLQASGVSKTSSDLAIAAFDANVALGKDPLQATIGKLESVAAAERGEQPIGLGSRSPFEIFQALKDELVGVSEERKRTADNLQQAAEALKVIAAGTAKPINRNGNVEPAAAVIE